MTFETWKEEALAYVHQRATVAGYPPDDWDWVLGGDVDMEIGFEDGELPSEYVEYQIECGQ